MAAPDHTGRDEKQRMDADLPTHPGSARQNGHSIRGKAELVGGYVGISPVSRLGLSLPLINGTTSRGECGCKLVN